MYHLENPNPHFLVGDVCKVVGTSHEIVIREINCNTGQTKDRYQWTYSAYVAKGSGLKSAWYYSDELDLITKTSQHPIMQWQTRRGDLVMNITASQPQQAAQSAAPSPQGYPIGSMILGTGKANNVWIVNKDNSRDISLLWDGKQAKFCSNELERTDRLVAGSHKTVRTSEVYTFIQLQIGPNKLSIPHWAAALILTLHKPLPQTKLGGVYGHTIISPAAVQSMVKAGIADPSLLFKDQVKKQIDTVTKTCDHMFQSYIGIREVYDFCVHCDFKVRAKQ